MAERPAKDHWTQEAYSTSAAFDPELATTILQWLDPQRDDVVLDLGCGDGVLTAKLKESCASVTGVDASANLITAAKKAYGSRAGLSWHVQDCRYLDRWINFQKEGYTKVFSNAALHWILRDPTTRESVLRNIYGILRPSGTFVFEMGGKGNVAEVHAALIAAVAHQGTPLEDARELCPWFFPSEALMKQMLDEVGFKIQRMESEYRPTKLTMEKDGGIEGWVRLMGASFLDGLDSPVKREAIVKEVCEVLKTVISHEEDGSMYLGYVRLRVLATKAV
ncbi:MAG: hypothetical protein LQ337_007771 [Flavoplaca oasis]|nr:MAG: hypothetical protein LQ337_007771 [Flavoplaca oasis]